MLSPQAQFLVPRTLELHHLKSLEMILKAEYMLFAIIMWKALSLCTSWREMEPNTLDTDSLQVYRSPQYSPHPCQNHAHSGCFTGSILCALLIIGVYHHLQVFDSQLGGNDIIPNSNACLIAPTTLCSENRTICFADVELRILKCCAAI